MLDVQGLVSALRVGGAVVYPLLLLAVVATVVILEKAFGFATRARRPTDVVQTLARPDFTWDDLEARVSRLGPNDYFGRFLRAMLDHRRRPTWWMESRGTEEAAAIEQSLGRWLWILETIVTAAPLLGLLGTITRLGRAFPLFRTEGLVDPRGVTRRVAGAVSAP